MITTQWTSKTSQDQKPQSFPRWRVFGTLEIVDNQDEDNLGRITRPVSLEVVAPDTNQAIVIAYSIAIARYDFDLTYFIVNWIAPPDVMPVRTPVRVQ